MIFINDVSTTVLMLDLCLLSIIYTAWLVAYRLWLSPVSYFPGPLWPKVTFWYEFYHEWIKPGQYHKKIQEMHAKYGEGS